MNDFAECWNENGIVNIRGEEVDSSAMIAIKDELEARRPVMQRALPHRDDVAVSRDCVVDSPQRCGYAGAGPALKSFAADRALLGLLRSITGIDDLVPIRRGYKYYTEGDYIGVHTDRQGCDVTLTVSYERDAEGIVYWPNLRRASRRQLVDAFEGPTILPSGGVPMDLDPGVLNIFAGHELPHARPQHGRGQTAIATVCYLSINP